MRKNLVILVVAGFILGACSVVPAAEKEGVAEDVGFKTFWIYRDKADRTNHYTPSGWMGDYGAIQMDDNCRNNPKSGMTSIKFSYTGDVTQGAGWAGVYWQNPANNWGYRKGGFDLTGASKLTFWARGEKGREVISKFKFGGITGEFSDSDSVEVGPVMLRNEWRQYTIDLTGCDLSYISGGFCWVTSRLDNSGSIVFYLDDIKYE